MIVHRPVSRARSSIRKTFARSRASSPSPSTKTPPAPASRPVRRSFALPEPATTAAVADRGRRGNHPRLPPAPDRQSRRRAWCLHPGRARRARPRRRAARPRLVMSTLPRMFAAMERRHGRGLPPDPGRSHRLLGGPHRQLGAGTSPGPRERRPAWRDVLLWDEHTWGADRGISDPDDPATLEQWRLKQRFALDAGADRRPGAGLGDGADRAASDRRGGLVNQEARR